MFYSRFIYVRDMQHFTWYYIWRRSIAWRLLFSLTSIVEYYLHILGQWASHELWRSIYLYIYLHIYFTTNNDLSYHLSSQNDHHHQFILDRSLFIATLLMQSLAFHFSWSQSLSNAPVIFPIAFIQSVDITFTCLDTQMSHTARFPFVKLQTCHKQTTFSRPLPVFTTH